MGLLGFGTDNPVGRDGDQITGKTSRLLEDLARILPENGLTASDRALKVHETDGYVTQRGQAAAIVRPQTTGQVQDILRLCHRHRAVVVPRGSGTSQVGGVVPENGAVVVSMSRMKSVLEFDEDRGLMRVQVGMTNLQVSRHAEGSGWFYAPNPSSQRTCTIGGNIATNSSGASFLRYGGTAENLVAARVVLDDGESIELTGDDPALSLICGSEGQMGLVTEARLRLHRIPESCTALVVGFANVGAALAFSQSVLAQCRCVSALDLMDRNAIRLTESFRPCGYPQEAEAVLLVELSGPASCVERETGALAALAESHHALACRASTDILQIWEGRNAIYGALGREQNFLSLDCAVPLSQLRNHFEQCNRLAEDHALRTATVIHCGDGTVHSFLLFDANDRNERQRADRCAALIRGLAAHRGGSISSEYGIGLRNREELAQQYSAPSLRQQAAIVQAFSARRYLNPGKCYPDGLEAIA